MQLFLLYVCLFSPLWGPFIAHAVVSGLPLGDRTLLVLTSALTGILASVLVVSMPRGARRTTNIAVLMMPIWAFWVSLVATIRMDAPTHVGVTFFVSVIGALIAVVYAIRRRGYLVPSVKTIGGTGTD
jgi:predicted membrane protein